MSLLSGGQRLDGAPAAAAGSGSTLIVESRPERVRARRRIPPVLAIGTVLLAVIGIVLLLTPWIAPYSPDQQDLAHTLARPNSVHWLGTDQLGRDVLARIMFGGRFSVTITAITLSVCAVVGTLLGIMSARLRGTFDEVVMRLCDVLLGFPEMIIAMFVVSILGASSRTLVLALTVAGWTPFAKLARGVALEVDSRNFIEAARALGFSRRYIIMRHLLPNSLSPLLAHAALRFGHILISVGALSFLGLGVQPPAADWGSMVSAAVPYLGEDPGLVIYPGLAIFITALSVTMIGQGINARRGTGT